MYPFWIDYCAADLLQIATAAVVVFTSLFMLLGPHRLGA